MSPTAGAAGVGAGKPPLTVRDWEHFDLAREPAYQDPLTDPDVATLRPLLKTVTATSATGYTIHGTMDLSTYNDMSPDMSLLTDWAGVPLPVTAKLDVQGRLTELSADLSDKGESDHASAGRLMIRITSYGDAVAPLPRPTAITEAPATLYQSN